MSQPELRPVTEEDIPAIEELLKAEWLPPFQVREYLETFWVLEDGARVVGAAGLEPYGEAGVIRSVVVAPPLRASRQGRRLVEVALKEARRRGIKRLYLFTMHAAPFFARFGFERCSLDDFEPAARAAWQYRAVSSSPELAGNVFPMRLDVEKAPEL